MKWEHSRSKLAILLQGTAGNYSHSISPEENKAQLNNHRIFHPTRQQKTALGDGFQSCMWIFISPKIVIVEDLRVEYLEKFASSVNEISV